MGLESGGGWWEEVEQTVVCWSFHLFALSASSPTEQDAGEAKIRFSSSPLLVDGEGATLMQALLFSDSVHSFNLRQEDINLEGEFNSQSLPHYHDLWVFLLHYLTSPRRIDMLYVVIYLFELL